MIRINWPVELHPMVVHLTRWNGLTAGVAVLTMIALVVTGYYGGDLVYGRRGRERERGGIAPVVRAIQSVQRPAAGNR
ncbi:MAG TPA: hypothetical protein VJT33_17285 [bacterium]|nr:hypothetical protein [bacterium]